MNQKDLQLVEVQSIAKRALLILEEHDFWETSRDGEFWEASLHRDLTKLAKGKELKTYERERKLMCQLIKDLEKENK